MVLTMVAERRNSPSSGRPSTSRRIVCRRSPWATARMVRVTSVVGHRRSSINWLIDVSMPPQAPPAEPMRTRCLVLPSRPTTCPTLSSCCAIRSLEATMSLKVSATLPHRPSQSLGRRTEKSPARMAPRMVSRSRSSAPSVDPFACGGDADSGYASSRTESSTSSSIEPLPERTHVRVAGGIAPTHPALKRPGLRSVPCLRKNRC